MIFRRVSNKFVLAVLAILFGFNLLLWVQVGRENSGFLKVVFFDVGQGDAILVETPKGTQILIDGGPSSAIVGKLGQELPFFDRSIDLVLSTHPDSDHLAGLVDVLKSYDVVSFGWSGVKSSSAESQELDRQMEVNEIKRVVLARGTRISVGKNLSLLVLAPLESFEGREVKDYNTSSLVLKMNYGQECFLFTGDAPVSVEKKLALAEDSLVCRVLKVGHHGSKTSTSELFLEKAEPRVAVIQVGKDNKYGHPSPEVLERLQNHGIKVLRTDQAGDIRIFSDGQNLFTKPN